MSMLTQEELLWRFGKAEDPEVEARPQRILDFLLETSPQKKQQLRQEGQQEGRLTEARAALRRVLAGRKLTPSQDDDARIDTCTDLATLERWHDRAITAGSISDRDFGLRGKFVTTRSWRATDESIWRDFR